MFIVSKVLYSGHSFGGVRRPIDLQVFVLVKKQTKEVGEGEEISIRAWVFAFI